MKYTEEHEWLEADDEGKYFQACWFVRIPRRLCRRLRIAILVPTVKESTAGSQWISFFECFSYRPEGPRISGTVTPPWSSFSLKHFSWPRPRPWPRRKMTCRQETV